MIGQEYYLSIEALSYLDAVPHSITFQGNSTEIFRVVSVVCKDTVVISSDSILIPEPFRCKKCHIISTDNAKFKKFHVNDIVYLDVLLMKVGRLSPTPEFPFIGTEYEIDGKVVGTRESVKNSDCQIATIVWGNGAMSDISSNNLISASDFLNLERYIPCFSNELVTESDVFFKEGGTYYNSSKGIHINENKIINKYFNKI